jgi:hypothetical protein
MSVIQMVGTAFYEAILKGQCQHELSSENIIEVTGNSYN